LALHTFEFQEDPVLVFKQLQSVLIVLLKSNVDPNFLRKDANFAKYLAEKIKPLFIEHFRADGLRFVTW
uniref:Omega globin n=1 Tax=Romanomermis culicivorax TaxID=13658 RepID=A0A915JV25_ROMCU